MTSLWDVEPVTSELCGSVRLGHVDENQERVPVHVHVMATKVERDKELEDERMLWIRRGEITEQAARGRPDHSNRIRTHSRMRESEAESRTHRSVTISSTAPNFDAWPRYLAACPSTASKSWEMQYATVE